jgi:UDP-N-acetylglucosamine 2-epimerase (non-hydrolysing)
MKKILIAFGTRPEVIKLAPVIKELKPHFEIQVLHSGQHKELVEPLLSLFNIEPDHDLKIMKEGQDLFELTQNLLPKLKEALELSRPDYVMVQGDTTTSYLTALAAFYLKIPVIHVEAGLRSNNPYYPFPEEINRKQISQLAEFHFAPTSRNEKNLLDDGISKQKVWVTGNTVIDALNQIKASEAFKQFEPEVLSGIGLQNKLVLLTTHRRENHGKPLLEVFNAVNDLLSKHPECVVIFPAHPNPAVKVAIEQAGIKNDRFIVSNPLNYLPFLKVMARANLILTDSGGIQEEAAALGKQILVLRNETERQELIDRGLGILVGTDRAMIIEQAEALLKSSKPSKVSSVFGDGTASQKIKEILQNQL